MLLKLISISQLICEVIVRLLNNFRIINVIIMNKIAEYREGFRKKFREQELNKIKNSLRNLLIYCPETTGENNQCSLCQDDRWMYGKQNINIISSVISTIFHNSYICQSHIDVFMARILQYVVLNPPLFGELIKSDTTETIWLILHKIIVLHQIFGNESIINNQGVKQYIVFNFQRRNEFIIKLMECAYFNEQFPLQLQVAENNSFYNLNRICFNCLYSIILKNPYLFLSYFDQYPFDYLIINSKGQKLTNIIRFIGEIIIENHENSQGMHLTHIVYNSFKNHLRNIQRNSSNFQQFTSYIQLIELIFDKLSTIDQQMMNLTISKITNQTKMVNSLHKSISNICSIISYKYIHYLSQTNQQSLRKILKNCHQLQNKEIKMQVQTEKTSMQIQ